MILDIFSEDDKDRLEQVLRVIKSGKSTPHEIERLICEMLHIAHFNGTLAGLELVGEMEQTLAQCQKAISSMSINRSKHALKNASDARTAFDNSAEKYERD